MEGQEFEVSTHSFNAAYDENNCYIRNENGDILLQRIADEQFIYVPQGVVYNVFGRDNTERNTETINRGENVLHNEAIAEDVDHTKRRVWSYEETRALITSVEVYKDHLHHVKKRKHVWQNISNDLLSQKIEYQPDVCKKKWLNLVKTYKNCKDVQGKSGRCPTRFLFFKELDEILGSEPNISSPHSLDPSENSENSMPQTPEGSIDVDDQENPTVVASPLPQTEERITIQTPKRKSSLTKIRDELKVLHEKVTHKRELEERKLAILEKKLKLEERKVIALEKIAGIIQSDP